LKIYDVRTIFSKNNFLLVIHLRELVSPPEVNTFYVSPFEFNDQIENAPATLNEDFTQALKDKITGESRLNFTDTDPDIEFSGNIRGFRVTSVAPQPDETTAFNRLEISVSIDFVNNQDEEQNWNSSFSFFNDYPSESNLLDIQDELITNIQEQLVEDIFNKAFTSW